MNKNIPHLCHLYWDKSPMALLQVFTIYSFHRYNPDWHIIIYLTKQDWKTEIGKNIYVPDYTGKDYFYLIEQLRYIEIQEIDLKDWEINLDAHSCQGSDIFRRNVLYQKGGVYSDFDVLWLKPIEYMEEIECLGNPKDFESIVSYYEYTHGVSNVSNLISEPGSQYLYSLIEAQRKVKPPYEHQAFGADMVTAIYPTWDSIVSKFPRMLGLKYETFYPYDTHFMDRLFVANDLKPLESKNVMCIHWFNGNTFSKQFVNQDRFFNCSMTSILEKEGYI
jgi:hypothetical protein